MDGTGTDTALPSPAASGKVDGFDVVIVAPIKAGKTSPATFTVTKAGAPVTDLKPYLGAFGHLVVLRPTDLAYLHVHPSADADAADAKGGPDVTFDVDTPESGLHVFYLQVASASGVHTVPFTVNAA